MSGVAIAIVAAVLAILAVFALVVYLQWAGQNRVRAARTGFQQQHPALREEFFRCAAASGKPKGLRWKECDWEDWVEFARHRDSGELVALASLTIHFEAVEGGDMEGVAAVSLPRNATAVFYFRQGRWQTAGRAIFNKNPDEAAAHFGAQYEQLSH